MTLKHKKGKVEVHDRQSRTGIQGLPKKNGAGGKYVWGAVGIQDGPAVLDEGDPNYVAEEERAEVISQVEAPSTGANKVVSPTPQPSPIPAEKANP
jgi:hypothetical protein